jgi:3-deoxy-D-manno-octulosonic-acid transferase
MPWPSPMSNKTCLTQTKHAKAGKRPSVLAGALLFAYSSLLTIVIALLGLRSAISMLWRSKHRDGLSERFGRVRPDLAAAVMLRRVVWVHAVSVGEVLAASQLVKDLGKALGEGSVVVVSTVTDTGQALAQQRFGVDHVFYAPIDFGFSVKAYLNALQPSAIVLIESGVWPRMMHECDKRGIPVIVANARVNDKSHKRALKMFGLWARWLRRATLWLAQSDIDAHRLVKMGVSKELVLVSGNLKYDVRAPKETHLALLIRNAAGIRPVIVAGSTMEANGVSEESMVLRAWQIASAAGLDSLLVLAPRHPERFQAVEALIAQYAYKRASDCTPPPRENGRLDIVLLDTIGDLSAVYSIADVAFVGGSLISRGGHNPLEPAQFAVPILMGQSFENFHGVVKDLTRTNAIQIVRSQNELASNFVGMLTNRETSHAMGERARQVFEGQRGATKNTVDVILRLMKP